MIFSKENKLAFGGLALLGISAASILFGKLFVNWVAFQLLLSGDFVSVASLNQFTFAFSLLGYAASAVAACIFVYLGVHSRFKVEYAVRHRVKYAFVGVACCLLLGSVLFTGMVQANSLAATGYYLATPYSPYDWLIGEFSTGMVYAINGSSWANMMTYPTPAPWTDYAGNATAVQEAALAATSNGTIFLKEVEFDLALMQSIPTSVSVIKSVNGLQQTFINPLDSQGSPYTISVSGSNYFAQDNAERYCYYSTNASYIVNSVVANDTKISFSSGDFYFDSSIILNDLHAISFEGINIDATTLNLAKNANCNLFHFNGTNTMYFLSISKMTLHGHNDVNTAGHGIFIDYTASNGKMNDIRIDDVFVKNFYQDGVHVESIWGLRCNRLISEYNTGAGLWLQVFGTNAQIQNCKLNSNTGSGFVVWLSNIGVSNCEIGDNTANGLHVGGASTGLRAVGNNLYGNNININLESAKDGVYIGNTLSSATTRDLTIAAISTNNSFIGNSFGSTTKLSDSTTQDNNYHHNIGLITESVFSGTNTTATTAVLAHGLASTPTYADVSFNSTWVGYAGYTWTSNSTYITITPTGTLPAAWTCYVNAVYKP